MKKIDVKSLASSCLTLGLLLAAPSLSASVSTNGLLAGGGCGGGSCGGRKPAPNTGNYRGVISAVDGDEIMNPNGATGSTGANGATSSTGGSCGAKHGNNVSRRPNNGNVHYISMEDAEVNTNSNGNGGSCGAKNGNGPVKSNEMRPHSGGSCGAKINTNGMKSQSGNGCGGKSGCANLSANSGSEVSQAKRLGLI